MTKLKYLSCYNYGVKHFIIPKIVITLSFAYQVHYHHHPLNSTC